MNSSSTMLVQRHILPVDVAPPLDENGFLELGPGRSWVFGSAALPLKLEVLSEDADSYVLLASDGVGKTRALRRLHDLEPGSTWIDLSHYEIDGLRSKLDREAVPGARVYIDAVDIALLYQPLMSEILAACLEDPALAHVSWRIACRPASWNARLSDAFGDHVRAQTGGIELHFPLKRQYTLLPLTRFGVLTLAEQGVSDPQAFVEALVESRLGRLSGHPGRILSVARRWASSQHLPRSQSDALEFEISELLAENSSAHAKQLSGAFNTKRKHVIAGRLGAFTMLSNADRYSSDARQQPNVTVVGNLPSEPEPDEPGVEYPPNHYEAVLGTALFDPAPDSTIGFRHQQYAEFLAARYLVNRDTPAEKIRMLLSVAEDGTLPRAMVGVAAWIAALKPDLIRPTVLANAIAFLQSRVDLPSDQLRCEIVERILTEAANEDIDPLFGLQLSNLAHPGLETQLMQRMEQSDLAALELWWIARLARDGHCAALCEPLARQLHTSSLPAFVRRACVQAIGAIGTPEQRQALTSLLDLPVEEDPDDEIFAAVLDAIYPELLTIDQLLAKLRPRRNEDFVGAYLVLLGDLPSRITAQELPQALKWASENAAEDRWGFGRFVEQLITAAWMSPQATELLPDVGSLVAASADVDHWGRGSFDSELPWVRDSDTDRRRRLLLSVLEHVGEVRSYKLYALALFTEQDALWAIEAMPNIDEPGRTILAQWIAHIQDPAVELVEAVLTLSNDHPAYEPTSFWRGTVPIDDPAAERHRRQLASEHENAAEKVQTRVQRETALLRAIEQTEENPEQWWEIEYWLAHQDDWLDFDLTKRQGWNFLAPEQQQHVLDLGLRYLRVHQLEPTNWLAANSISAHQVLPDWSGAHLLATIALHRPDSLESLDVHTWERWAPAVIGSWDPYPSTNDDARKAIADNVPPAAVDAYTDALIRHLDVIERTDRSLTRNPSIDWATRVANADLSERLIAGAYSGQLAYDLIALIADLDQSQAMAMCRQMQGDTASPLRPRAARMLAELAPNEAVAYMRTSTWTDQDLHIYVPRIAITNLEISDLEVLAKFLLDRFPLADDPPFEDGWVGESYIQDTLQTRGRTLERLANLGQAEVLGRLAQDRRQPEANYLKGLVRRARIAAADLAIRPIEPQGLLRLLELADARVIRNAGDLLDAVVHQLNTIQHQLRRTGLHRDVWNDSVEPSPKSEDSISDWLQRELQHRLERPIFIDREIQVRRTSEQGIGTRIDLSFSTTSDTHIPVEIRTIIEAKLANNSEVDTAMEHQLQARYMEPLQLSHAIYIVFWIQLDQRPETWPKRKYPSVEALLEQLQSQADSLPGVKIVPFVLDISKPN